MKRRIAALFLALMLLPVVPAFATEGGGNGPFARSKTYEGQFSDLERASPYYESITALYEYGLTLGRPDGTYGPEEPMTVGEIIIFAGRIRSLYRTGDTETGPDGFRQGEEPVACRYLRYLQAEEVLDTALDGRLEEQASRGELAHVLAKLLPPEILPEVNGVIVTEGWGKRWFIKDVKSGTPYCQDILYLYRCGLTAGEDGKGSFRPEETASRGAAADMLARLLDGNLRITLDWDVSGPNTAVGTALKDLVPRGTYIASPATEEELDQSIRYMLASGSSKLNLRCPGMPAAEIQKLKSRALYLVETYSEQSYRAVSCSYNRAGDVELTFTASEPQGTGEYRNMAMKAAVAFHDEMWASGKITAAMSEYDRAKAYYTWLCKNCVYDYRAGGGSVSHVPYSLFERGTAVCDGYTGALNMLLKLEGIECAGLACDGHIWTVATLDGKQVHIDATLGGEGKAVDYSYFAMTPEQCWERHPWDDFRLAAKPQGK